MAMLHSAHAGPPTAGPNGLPAALPRTQDATSYLDEALRAAVRRDGIDPQREVAVVRRMAGTGRFDALVALGCVIRGRTPHFDYVAGEAALVGRVAAETGVPVTFGVLTTEDSDQAAERSGGKLGNKGWDAAQAAIETARLLADLK